MRNQNPRTAAFEIAVGGPVFSIYPGAINDRGGAGGVNEIALAGGVIHSIEIYTLSTCVMNAYDYRDPISDQPIYGGASNRRFHATVSGGFAVSGGETGSETFDCWSEGRLPVLDDDNRLMRGAVLGGTPTRFEWGCRCPYGMILTVGDAGAGATVGWVTVTYTPTVMGATRKRQAEKGALFGAQNYRAGVVTV